MRTEIDRWVEEQDISLRRAGTPGDIAALVAFLVSDEDSWITSGDYLIDGGTVRH